MRILKMMETKKISMNDDRNRFESGTLKGKMKEISSVSFFALVAVLLAIVLSDLIFFPLAYYSVRNVDIFNILFRYATLFVISALMITLLYLKVRSLHRDGYTFASIMIYVFRRPFQYLGFFIFVLLLISLLIILIYFLFSSNYYHLHRIAGGA